MMIIAPQNKINLGHWSTTIKFGFKKTIISTTTSPNLTPNTATTTILCFIISIILFFSFSFSLTGTTTITSSNMAALVAFAQLSNNNNNTSVYSTFPNSSPDTDRAPAFLDAYWTNYLSSSSTASNTNSVKKEVGPGDGASTLAVVFVNSGRSDITGVTGYLNMPTSGGFTSIAGKNNGTSQSVASAYSIVKAGDTFALYFDMNVLKQAKVGGYSTTLTLNIQK